MKRFGKDIMSAFVKRKINGRQMRYIVALA